MSSSSFTIGITGWTTQVNGSRLPICEIVSPIAPKRVTLNFDVFSPETRVVHAKNGNFVSSFIFWSDARAYIVVDAITAIMVNLEDKVGVFLYSNTTDFAVLTSKGDESNVIEAFVADDKRNIWHGFAVLEGEEKIQVKIGV